MEVLGDFEIHAFCSTAMNLNNHCIATCIMFRCMGMARKGSKAWVNSYLQLTSVQTLLI